MRTLFSEKQRFTQWWLWAILIALDALMIYGFVQQLIFKIPFGNNPSPDWVLVIFGLIPFGISWLIYAFRLETKITNEFMAFELYPLCSLNTIKWEEIETIYVREYSPLKEFGGWGYRVSSNGTAYNISGNQGLQLKLKNGKKILIGTQKAEEVKQILNDLHIN